MTTGPTAEEFLTETLDLLGSDGEHWIKGHAYSTNQQDMCLLGGLEQAGYRVAMRYWHAGGEQDLGKQMNSINYHVNNALERLAQEMFPDRMADENSTVVDFNDHPDTIFPDVRALVEKTRIQLTERVTP